MKSVISLCVWYHASNFTTREGTHRGTLPDCRDRWSLKNCFKYRAVGSLWVVERPFTVMKARSLWTGPWMCVSALCLETFLGELFLFSVIIKLFSWHLASLKVTMCTFLSVVRDGEHSQRVPHCVHSSRSITSHASLMKNRTHLPLVHSEKWGGPSCPCRPASDSPETHGQVTLLLFRCLLHAHVNPVAILYLLIFMTTTYHSCMPYTILVNL